MDRGLWRYMRHPNHFGDFCVCWGLFFIAAAGGAGWTLASPLVMSFLLLKVSGVMLPESTSTEPSRIRRVPGPPERVLPGTARPEAGRKAG